MHKCSRNAGSVDTRNDFPTSSYCRAEDHYATSRLAYEHGNQECSISKKKGRPESRCWKNTREITNAVHSVAEARGSLNEEERTLSLVTKEETETDQDLVAITNLTPEDQSIPEHVRTESLIPLSSFFKLPLFKVCDISNSLPKCIRRSVHPDGRASRSISESETGYWG